MVSINLLPWREAEKLRQQARFNISIIVSLLFAVLFIIFFSKILNNELELQMVKQQFLKDEIAIVDDRIVVIETLKKEKAELSKRIALIKRLQSVRNVPTKLLDALANVTPQGVYLETVKRDGSILWIEGVAESNNHLANMLRNFESYKWFKNPLVEKIELQHGNITNNNKFSLHVDIKDIIE